MKLNKYSIASALLIAVFGIVFAITSFNKPLSDWGNYYYGSNLLLQGKFSEDVYECYKFNSLVRAEGETDVYLNYTPIPPFTALFYVPLQFTSSRYAKLIFNILSVLLFAFSMFRLLKFLGIESVYALLVPIVLIVPFRNNILFGQTYLLLISFLIEGYIANSKGKPIITSLFWSIAILLKIFPGIVLLYLLFTKQYRALIYTVIAMAVLSVITAAVTGWGLNYNYFAYIVPRLLNNEINDTFSTSYQTMGVLLRKLFVYDKLLNPGAPADNFLLYKIISSLFTAAVLFVSAMFSLDKSKQDFQKFTFWLLGGLLVTGYASNYSLILLLFILISIVNLENAGKLKLIFLFATALAIGTLPLSYFSKLSILLQFPRFYLLLLFFITVLIIYRPKLNLKFSPAILVLALFLIIIGLKPFDDGSQYLLDKEEALLINDYSESNGKLIIVFTDQNGRNEKELPLKVNLSESPELRLAGRDIFYGNQLIAGGNDLKLKPMLNNNGEIYYLSDKYRGVGFYTLRKIRLDLSK